MKQFIITLCLLVTSTSFSATKNAIVKNKNPRNPTSETENTSIRKKLFLKDGIFIVPDDVSTIYINASAGGGGGGSAGQGDNVTMGGGGGAGSAIYFQAFQVTPGDTLKISVGVAGLGGEFPKNITKDGKDGTAGGNTIIGNLITLNGGSPGGAGRLNDGRVGGNGGDAGNIGATHGTAGTLHPIFSGGYGGSNFFGHGGAGGSANPIKNSRNAPQPGAGFGSGGGGGVACSNVDAWPGAKGAGGFVMIEW